VPLQLLQKYLSLQKTLFGLKESPLTSMTVEEKPKRVVFVCMIRKEFKKGFTGAGVHLFNRTAFFGGETFGKKSNFRIGLSLNWLAILRFGVDLQISRA
jgi:hypothetical protein